MANIMQRHEKDLQTREKQILTQMQDMMSRMLSQNSSYNNINKKKQEQ